VPSSEKNATTEMTRSTLRNYPTAATIVGEGFFIPTVAALNRGHCGLVERLGSIGVS
jgi:hypothetical protein